MSTTVRAGTAPTFPNAPAARRLAWAGRRLPLGYAVIGAVGVVLIFVFIRFTVDDAFISWRYALTFVRTGQWNYTAGIPRVEGYTDFLYTALAVVPALLHIPIEAFFKLVSLAVLGGYLVAVHRLTIGTLQKLALWAVVLCNPTFMILLFSGLETVSFALGVALIFALVYRNGALRPLGYLAALAVALSRPEGIVFAGVAMAWSLIVTRRRQQWLGLGAVGVLWALYWGWRWSYFGYFWPGAYYVKSGARGAVSAQVVGVLTGLVPAVVVAGLVLLVAALVPQIDRRALRNLVGTAQDATPMVLAATSAVVVLGLYHSSNLEMDFVNRFQWQLLFPVVVVGLSRPLVQREPPAGPARIKTAPPAPEASGSRSASEGPPRLTLRFTTRTETKTATETRLLPPAAEFWALLAIVVAVVTSLADEPARLGQIAVTGAAIVVAVAVILRSALGRSAATVLAAVALAVVVSTATVSELVGWAAYRIRLEYAHQAMGQVIGSAPFRGAIAISDAGIMAFKVHQPVIDLGGMASAPVAHDRLTSEDLAKEHLDLVVALSSSPAAGSEWSAGNGEAAYAYMTQHGWASSQGPPFGAGYWLNYWVNPAVDTAGLRAGIARVTARAMAENLQPDSSVLSHNLFDFPFLTSGN